MLKALVFEGTLEWMTEVPGSWVVGVFSLLATAI
jgi:hypothetical protein